MTSVKENIEKLTDWLRKASELGIAMIMTLVMIDILFPGTTGVVANLGVIVAQFSKEGLAGLIALLLFLVLFKNKT